MGQRWPAPVISVAQVQVPLCRHIIHRKWCESMPLILPLPSPDLPTCPNFSQVPAFPCPSTVHTCSGRPCNDHQCLCACPCCYKVLYSTFTTEYTHGACVPPAIRFIRIGLHKRTLVKQDFNSNRPWKYHRFIIYIFLRIGHRGKRL